jgi:hypothetical protein
MKVQSSGGTPRFPGLMRSGNLLPPWSSHLEFGISLGFSQYSLGGPILVNVFEVQECGSGRNDLPWSLPTSTRMA